MEKPGDNASTLNLDEEKYAAGEAETAAESDRGEGRGKTRERSAGGNQGEKKARPVDSSVRPSVYPARLCFVKFKELLARG